MPLGCVLLTGERFNALKDALVTSSSASAVPSLASLAVLHDGRSNQAFRFAAPAGSVEWITADVRRLANGGFEAWSGGAPVGWTAYTTGSATLEQETVVVDSGSYACSLSKSVSGDTALVRQDVLARSGARFKLSWALRGNGSMPSALLVYNRRTARYLAADGTWSASATAVAVQTAGHYLQASLEFDVEAFRVTHADTCELLVQAYAGAGTGKVYVDSLVLVPVLDFCSVHGHNLDPGVLVELVGSNDGFATETLVAILSAYAPAFYRRFAPVAFTHWRLRFTGTPVEPIWLAECVLGRAYTPARIIRQGMKLRDQERQVRQDTPAGGRVVYNRTAYADRIVDLGWQLLSADQVKELRWEVFARARGGLRSFVIVPWLDTVNRATPPEAERLVLLGTVDPDVEVTWPGIREYRLDLTVAEQAYPAVDELV